MAETCYRHPTRDTNVSCSRCGRPICPECMHDSPVGMRCPECAGERTRARTLPLRRAATPYATYALIALNVIVFIAEIGGGGGGAASLQGGGRLIVEGGLLGPAIADQHEYYRIVTSGFLHAGPLHLFLNMFVLYILGNLLEEGIGTARLVGIYFVSLLAGSFGALLLDPDKLTVGASGAVYGIMAATFLVARQRGVEQLASQIGLWVVLNLVFTLSVPGISIGGHVGGLLGGAAAAVVIIAGERRGGAAGAEALGLLVIGAISVAGALWAAGMSGSPGVGLA
jgi:membrane associated rhomboid family serine protease